MIPLLFNDDFWPESIPDVLTGSGFGSGKMVRIPPDLAPQHCFCGYQHLHPHQNYHFIAHHTVKANSKHQT